MSFSEQPSEIIGVDWSGARDAGRRAWVAWGPYRDGEWTVEDSAPAREVVGGSTREEVIAGLRAWLTPRAAAVGCDFPFGLPAALVERAGAEGWAEPTWRGVLLALPRRFSDADALRDWCRASDGGRELRRKTDREARTPFAAYNLRLYRQTWWGLTALLAPLVEDGVGSVLPVQSPGRLPWLLETCPASLLKRTGLYRPYKGGGDELRRSRLALLRELEEGVSGVEIVSLPRAARRRVIADRGGDGLDAVACGVAVAAALRSGRVRDEPGPDERLEAMVFA